MDLLFWLGVVLYCAWLAHMVFAASRDRKKLEADQKQLQIDRDQMTHDAAAVGVIEVAERWAEIRALFPKGSYVTFKVETKKHWDTLPKNELSLYISGVGHFYGSTVDEVLSRAKAVLDVDKTRADVAQAVKDKTAN